MDALVKEAHEKMKKSLENLGTAFGKLRSGRANPAVLSGISCDYYGDKMDISLLSSITCPEPRQILIKPYSREDLKTIAAAIQAANLGLNPQVEADCIRIIVPPLTEDVRKDISKQAKSLAEECKIAIRNIRRDTLDTLKKDDSMSDDYKDRVEDEVQKVVDEHIKKVDEALASKQKEIMTV